MTSKNRSRSSIFELNQDTPEIHPWHKFGPNVTNMCGVIVFTIKIANFHVEIDPLELIFVELSCLQAKNLKFHV